MASLRLLGQLYPILVRPLDGLYEIIDGATRLLAAESLGWSTILCIIDNQSLDANAGLHRQIVTNCVRTQLDPIELGIALQRFMDAKGIGIAEARNQLCLKPGVITKAIKPLTSIEDSIKADIRSGKIPRTAAYYLARLAPEERSECARQIVAGELTRDGLAEFVTNRRRGASQTNSAKSTRVTMALGNRTALTITGKSIGTLDELINALKSALSTARNHHSRGTDLQTFLRLVRQKSKAGKGNGQKK